MASCLTEDFRTNLAEDNNNINPLMYIVRTLLVNLTILLNRVFTGTNLSPELKADISKAISLVKEILEKVNYVIEGRVQTPDTVCQENVPNKVLGPEKEHSHSPPQYFKKETPRETESGCSRATEARAIMASDDGRPTVSVPSLTRRKSIKRPIPRHREERKGQNSVEHIPIQTVEFNVNPVFAHGVDVPVHMLKLRLHSRLTLRDFTQRRYSDDGTNQNYRPRSVNKEKDIVHRNIRYLKEEIDTRIKIADYMFEKEIFTFDDSKLVRSYVTMTQANNEFFDMLHDNRKANKYKIFLAALKQYYPQVAGFLTYQLNHS